MILWMILTLMVALAAVALTIPLVRRRDAAMTARSSTLEVLKAQLGDLDAQAASGALSADDADGLRTEIKRRILAEGREAPEPERPISARNLMYLAFGMVAVVALAAVILYARMGKPELASSPAAASSAAATGHPGGGDVEAMIGQLEVKLKQSPSDSQGWGMLGWSYFQTGRFAQAADAYAKASTLDPTKAEYLSAEGESLVRSGDGQVTPAAQDAFRRALSVDPGDPRARYFLAVLKDQQGDHKGAMDDWIALLRTAPPGAPWAAEVRGFVERTARERGEDIASRLPPASSATPDQAAATPGPDSAQVAAADQMSDADRQRMISSMVEGLAAKLKANPKDAEGWVRLMRARMVLGQADQAAVAYRDASRAFAGAPQQAQIRDAARGMGVPGA